MPSVQKRDGEPFDVLLRRFKKLVDKSGLSKEWRNREHHQKGSKIRQHKLAAAKKRLFKRLCRERGKLEDRRRR